MNAGERFPCSFCEYKAFTKQHIEEHTQSIHDGMKYCCKLCKTEFSHKGGLYQNNTF